MKFTMQIVFTQVIFLLQPRDINNDAPFEAGARGGAEAGGRNDLRRSVTSLIDAMRDLISTAHNAADMPNEADVDSDDDTRDA